MKLPWLVSIVVVSSFVQSALSRLAYRWRNSNPHRRRAEWILFVAHTCFALANFLSVFLLVLHHFSRLNSPPPDGDVRAAEGLILLWCVGPGYVLLRYGIRGK
jgi:hypothetical protein